MANWNERLRQYELECSRQQKNEQQRLLENAAWERTALREIFTQVPIIDTLEGIKRDSWGAGTVEVSDIVDGVVCGAVLHTTIQGYRSVYKDVSGNRNTYDDFGNLRGGTQSYTEAVFQGIRKQDVQVRLQVGIGSEPFFVKDTTTGARDDMCPHICRLDDNPTAWGNHLHLLFAIKDGPLFLEQQDLSQPEFPQTGFEGTRLELSQISVGYFDDWRLRLVALRGQCPLFNYPNDDLRYRSINKKFADWFNNTIISVALYRKRSGNSIYQMENRFRQQLINHPSWHII